MLELLLLKLAQIRPPLLQLHQKLLRMLLQLGQLMVTMLCLHCGLCLCLSLLHSQSLRSLRLHGLRLHGLRRLCGLRLRGLLLGL